MATVLVSLVLPHERSKAQRGHIKGQYSHGMNTGQQVRSTGIALGGTCAARAGLHTLCLYSPHDRQRMMSLGFIIGQCWHCHEFRLASAVCCRGQEAIPVECERSDCTECTDLRAKRGMRTAKSGERGR